jgi:hypothetical protein
MQTGRNERRIAVHVPARLEIPGDPIIVERVSLENISVSGARIVAKRHCQIHDRVVFCDMDGGFRVEGEVVYCRPLIDGQCAIGLRFDEAVRGNSN